MYNRVAIIIGGFVLTAVVVSFGTFALLQKDLEEVPPEVVINHLPVNEERVLKTAALQKKIVLGDADNDSLIDLHEFLYNTDYNKADTDNDGFLDGEEVLFGYDPTGEGRPALELHIPRIAVRAPITHPDSPNEDDVQYAMSNGVALYPGTAAPGQQGNAYITGHSSDYVWNEGTYKEVFRELNQLTIGDTIYIQAKLSQGGIITYTYKVYEKNVVPVDDERLWFAEQEGSFITLVTSWPINTSHERLMVRALLTPNQ